jgi:hypothetical protein
LPRHWWEETDGPNKNIGIINKQINEGFVYQNPNMRLFIQAASQEVTQTGSALTRDQVENIMRKVWDKKPVVA